MDKQEREKFIDKLLIFMNDEAEKKGIQYSKRNSGRNTG